MQRDQATLGEIAFSPVDSSPAEAASVEEKTQRAEVRERRGQRFPKHKHIHVRAPLHSHHTRRVAFFVTCTLLHYQHAVYDVTSSLVFPSSSITLQMEHAQRGATGFFPADSSIAEPASVEEKTQRAEVRNGENRDSLDTSKRHQLPSTGAVNGNAEKWCTE